MTDTTKSGLRVVASFVWALVPAVTLGLATPVAFVYAATKKRSVPLAVATAVYTALLFVVLIISDPDNLLYSIAMIINIVVGTLHAFVVRAWVFDLDEVSPSRARTLVDQQKNVLASLTESDDARRKAQQIADTDPRLALRLGIGRVDLHDRDFPDGGLVDANNVPAHALAKNLDWTLDLSENIVKERKHRGEFMSAADLSVRLDLPPDFLDHVEDRLVFLPISRGRLARGSAARRR